MNPTTLQCPTCGGSDDTMGVEVRGVYDGVLYWLCERDNTRWHRWPEGHWLRDRAEPYVNVTYADPEPPEDRFSG